MNQQNDYQRRMSQILLAKLRQQKGKCHWCQCPIVHTPTILKELRLKRCIITKISSFIIKYTDELECKFRLNRATIDHLKEKSQGGADTTENLVASCYPCNSTRSKHLNMPKMEYEEDVKVKILKDWEMPSKIHTFHIGEIYQAKYRSNKSVILKLENMPSFITLPKGFYHVIAKVESDALPNS